MTELLRLVSELIAIILASPNPRAAVERAKVAAETEALNHASDEILRRLP